ncbi:MAG: hypothetical protein AAGG01_05525 [Planctomycetota bacterium]
MSRAFDVLLLVLIGFVAWKLARADDHLALAQDGHEPVTVHITVEGTEPLEGLGLLITPVDALQAMGSSETDGADEIDSAPHQLAPFQGERTTQIVVPGPGRYRLRWGIQSEGPAPRRPRDVTQELPPEAKFADQIIRVNGAAAGEARGAQALQEAMIQLPAAHAAGLRALAR